MEFHIARISSNELVVQPVIAGMPTVMVVFLVVAGLNCRCLDATELYTFSTMASAVLCTAIHYNALRYTTLHCTSLHYTTLHYAAL